VTTPLIEHHVLEYPGGYTRSVGPALSRFFGGLRDGKIVGVRLSDGRVMVPPTEYDPLTAAELTDYVDVGPAGTVVAWTWVAEPRAGKHHLDHPFAFALVKPDGADTAMVHVIDAPQDQISTGMRVQPRFRAERVGYVTDLEAWVPLADGGEPAPAPPNQAAGEGSDEPVTGIVTPIRLEYEINAGTAPSRYLRGMAEGKILGARANDSDQVYVPPRGSDPTTGAPTDVEVEVADVGTVTTFCVVNIPGLSETAPEIPYVCAQILLDGGNTPWFGLVQGLPVDEVRMGMRVKAVWVDDLKPDARNIKWFEPTGEPDADYETYKDYA
jgi:uncharacterized OB-fold protein